MAEVFDPKNRRNFFRLRFPYRERPSLIVREETYPVTEISERGLRFESIAWPPSWHSIEGTLILRTGKQLRVEGRIGRQDRREVIVVQLRGISIGDVFQEQRRLIQKYPMLQF